MTRASNSTLNGEQVSKKKQKFQQEKTMDLQMAERHTVWFFFISQHSLQDYSLSHSKYCITPRLLKQAHHSL